MPIASDIEFRSRLSYVLRAASKKVAFVVGSGLTRGTVPGVSQIVNAMRAALEDKSDQQRFDSALKDLSAGEQYQAAAKFLINNRDQGLLNEVIRVSVLKSYNPLAGRSVRGISRDEAALRDLEMDHNGWELDPGVAALGALLANLPNDVRGPVLTTNFDPHIEIAIKRAGGTHNAHNFDADGVLLPSDDSGQVDIYHVHGHWRRGDTLHTVGQLTAPRPMLSGSIREQLRGHTVIILGYSGWEDAFSNSLLDRAKEHQLNGMEIVWCTHGQLTDTQLQLPLFAELSKGNSAVIYQNIDSNEVLPDAFREYKKHGLPTVGDIKGWTEIDSSYIRLRTSDKTRSLVPFFNGVEPSWQDAVDLRLPKLSLAERLKEELFLSLEGDSDTIIVAGVAPMGEGKSIALRQVAVELTVDSRFRVFWREPGSPLSVDEILKLTLSENEVSVLVTDDGDLLVGELVRLVKSIATQNRQDIRVLLTAPERDWTNAGAYHRLASASKFITPDPLSEEEASAIVRCWAAFGSDGLGDLVAVEKHDRVNMLLNSSADVEAGTKGSLIGAMLGTRLHASLDSRVENLMARLDNHSINGGSTLTDAFLMICVMHSSFDPLRRSAPLSLRLLESAFNLDEHAARYVIIEPLGREAAVTSHGVDIWVRHKSIADAALRVSVNRRDKDEIHAVIDRIVRSAVAVMPPGPLDDDLYSAAYLSGRLSDPHEKITAAICAYDAKPNRLSFRTSLMAAY